MTSSLVGSEMCIRDSQRAADEKRGKGRQEKSEVGEAGPWCVTEVGQDVCCLLYTSDAADDM
eukprot:7292310-Prorocentrum_lima.AAC.1